MNRTSRDTTVRLSVPTAAELCEEQEYGKQRNSPVVVLPADLIKAARMPGQSSIHPAQSWDNDDVYSLLTDQEAQSPLTCRVDCSYDDVDSQTRQIPDPPPDIWVIVPSRDDGACSPDAASSAKLKEARAFVLRGGRMTEAKLIIAPVEDELYSRSSGIIESDALAEAIVTIVGIGSIGSPVAKALAQAGVRRFRLIDPDRLEVGNIGRHEAPIYHVGRFKTKSMVDILRGKNPACDVETWESEISFRNIDVFRSQIRGSDIVVCGADSHEGRLAVNRLCLDEDTPCVFAGLHRRAYGGQVLFCRPFQGPCLVCHEMASPGSVKDREVSTAKQASRLAYSDKEVPIEPGLANDVAPITTMVTKLVIQYLLQGKTTTLRSLDDDLIAPLYVWWNRREPGTPSGGFKPMGYDAGDLAVLRWYGLPAQRVPTCPCCGDIGAIRADLPGQQREERTDGKD